MMADSPLSYTGAQQSRIETFARLARGILSHPGEKGRVLEGIVAGALRDFLPKRFSLGTGFAVNSKGVQSKQLDIVIYDHEQNAPMMFDNDVGVFPIEAIYAVVEVKTTLKSSEIERAVLSFDLLRKIAAEKHYILFEAVEVEKGSFAARPRRIHVDVAPRTFVFALETDYGGPQTLLQALETGVRGTDAHFHGVCVLNADYIFSQIAFGGGAFKAHQGDAFRVFCRSVLNAVNSIQMMPAWMEDYRVF